MPQPIVLTTKHQLGVAGVKQRIDERFEALKSNGTLAKVADIGFAWDGDTASFGAKAMGQKMKGTIVVTEEDLTITLHLPALLTPFRGAIVALIKAQKDAVKGGHGQATP